jgi:hypothetical protein
LYAQNIARRYAIIGGRFITGAIIVGGGFKGILVLMCLGF